MQKNMVKIFSVAGVLSAMVLSSQAQAAIALDRTRVIFNGSEKSVSLNISNKYSTAVSGAGMVGRCRRQED